MAAGFDSTPKLSDISFIHRDAGAGGGGDSGGTAPQHGSFGSVAPPPTSDCLCHSFLFVFLHVNLGPSRK